MLLHWFTLLLFWALHFLIWVLWTPVSWNLWWTWILMNWNLCWKCTAINLYIVSYEKEDSWGWIISNRMDSPCDWWFDGGLVFWFLSSLPTGSTVLFFDAFWTILSGMRRNKSFACAYGRRYSPFNMVSSVDNVWHFVLCNLYG